jgi:transcriptional regulator with AAA-type ATPase domain
MPWGRGREEVRHGSCSAYAERATLAEKLFGPDPGAALPLVEEARGGTLCLEDIEALPNALQARLLTFINEQAPRPRPASSRSATAHGRQDAARMRCAPTCSSGSRR